MDTLKLKIVNSHYLIETGDSKFFLIDTGSPMSFSRGVVTSITLGGTDYPLQSNEAMIDNINSSGLFQEQVEGLIGMDVLCGHTFEFDKVSGTVRIDAAIDEEDYHHTVPMEISNIMGQINVIIAVKVNGRPVRTIIDTGAWISYLSSQYLSSSETIGTIQDYNPVLGDFETTKHNVRLSLGEFEQNISVGKMPPLLEAVLSMISTGFVLGLDAIECDRICLDLKAPRLLYA